MRSILYWSLGIGLVIMGCQETHPEIKVDKLFTLLPAAYTNIDFVNEVQYTETFNPYVYRNFFNGGGVGLGDINNDGLVDIFFCGNMKDNKLYLNKGNFQFEDITRKAGVASKGVWSTGVSFVDINGDGYLDIYVCKSGAPTGEHRHNEFFINNGDLTFTEKAEEYGIADLGLSTHAAFFDYDKDGDLDCYLLNNSFRPVGRYDLRPDQRNIRDSLGGNKFYRNDFDIQKQEPHFVDISEEANIYGSSIGFGLGVTIGDVNRDGWQDIFVSNDFFERDYLYINQMDGTFSEELVDYMGEISLGSMGADMADVNNDGYPEVYVTDMLPEDEARMKTKTRFDNWDKYEANLKSGYYRQFTRNMLQLNNGPALREDGTKVSFSEIGRIAGTYATDWSWGALIMDMDNDGWKDIFVANGIFKDLTDQDYINFYSSDPELIQSIRKREKGAILKLFDIIPSERIPNYAFANNGSLGIPGFKNKALEWGLNEPSFSNGSAYGDLDNDGDLDLVINNCNMPAFIYRNEADTLLVDNHYLQIRIQGSGANSFGLGTQVTLYCKDKTFYQELAPMRGYQSCVDYKLHFGLGRYEKVDSLVAVFPNGRVVSRQDISVDQLIELKEAEAKIKAKEAKRYANDVLVKEITSESFGMLQHHENEFVDFDKDRLMYHMLSTQGPAMATADVNRDGLEDIFLGGAKGFPAKLLIQQRNGAFTNTNVELFEKDKVSEDVDAVFFDADQDGDQDLYVASGGYEFSSSSSNLRDRLYMNNGKGGFTKHAQSLPTNRFESSSCVAAADYDKDGDIDLFVGLRVQLNAYGVPVNAYLLNNDGKGNFTNVNATAASFFNEIGMVTDALWMDWDQDNDQDLLVVGEWLPIRLFDNRDGKFFEISEKAGLNETNGFWNVVQAADLDGDGDQDFIAGNLGLNTRFKASAEHPVCMYVNDFDQNRRVDQVICVFNGNNSYPLALRHDLVMQMPELKKKYLRYENYKEQTISDIFTPEQLEKSIKWEVFTTESMVFMKNDQGRYERKPLPTAAQLAPIFGLLIKDINQDGHMDIISGGNFYKAKPETGIYDASHGLLLNGDGTGNFTSVPAGKSGFFVKGEIRAIESLKWKGKSVVLVARNDDRAVGFEVLE